VDDDVSEDDIMSMEETAEAVELANELRKSYFASLGASLVYTYEV